MRTLAHISDLHFGADVPKIALGLLESLKQARPDLVIVSGDLTQRATSYQFAEARRFLDKIPFPLLIVPGNHDVSLFHLFRRFMLPLDRYRNHITQDLAPYFRDQEVAVLGINTARSFTWKNGRVSVAQMELIRERFCPLPEDIFKILVTHHPFIAPPGREDESVVGRAEKMFLLVDGCNPDMALAGHFHMSYSGESHSVYTSQKGSTLVIQAGTAISSRISKEKNSYNVLRIDGGQVDLTVYTWKEREFVEYCTERFRRNKGRWQSSRATDSYGNSSVPASDD